MLASGKVVGHLIYIVGAWNPCSISVLLNTHLSQSIRLDESYLMGGASSVADDLYVTYRQW